jgi:adenylate cyclase
MAWEDDVRLKGGEVRLWGLIEERTKPGADKARIDRRLWDLFGEDWAVMFTDLSGFSRRVAEFGIIHFLQVIHEHKRLLLPNVAAYDGILLKIEADSFMVIFKRPESALACAIEMQHACQRHSRPLAPEEKVLLCVGIGFGRILRIGDTDVYGQEVNAAAKLGEDTARSNEILVTGAVRDACLSYPGVTFAEHAGAIAGSSRNYRVEYPPAAE